MICTHLGLRHIDIITYIHLGRASGLLVPVGETLLIALYVFISRYRCYDATHISVE